MRIMTSERYPHITRAQVEALYDHIPEDVFLGKWKALERQPAEQHDIISAGAEMGIFYVIRRLGRPLFTIVL